MAEVPGSIFYCWIFCFQVVKPLMAMLPLLQILCMKNSIEGVSKSSLTVSS